MKQPSTPIVIRKGTDPIVELVNIIKSTDKSHFDKKYKACFPDNNGGFIYL